MPALEAKAGRARTNETPSSVLPDPPFFAVNNVPVATSKSESRVFSGRYDNVFRAVCDAGRAEAMTAQFGDPAAGRIRLSTGMSLATWGENLE